ncbi:MAG: hypothetical protein A2Y33_05870 [Spirochaetes bacterium GWF1_51_8]|nr:MAG: hypothetical protein A2Y33_05870 [Spirochaetes bacterium GWF1_51_8]
MKPITISGLSFRNPVLTASGTFGMGGEFEGLVDYSRLGGITLKTVTPNPRAGNLPPRIIETPCGLLNSIGLENPGIDAAVAEIETHRPFAKMDTNIIFSIAGESTADFVRMAERVIETGAVDMLELNLSCPNLHAGGATFDSDCVNVREIVSAVERLGFPFTVKLSPNNDIIASSLAAEDAGAPCLTISNTYLGMAFDRKTGEPLFRNKVAGFSGPAVKPIALYNVYRVANKVKVPIIASGGVACTEDAVDFILAGAALVSIGTMNFVEPDIAETIAMGLTAYFKEK